MLIVPSNDCYFAEEHTDMEKMIREWVTNGGVVIHGPDCGLSKNCFGIQGIPDSISYEVNTGYGEHQ